MLVYVRVGPGAYRHDSVTAGKVTLQEIAIAQGFEVTFAEDNELITASGLAGFELVFFLGTAGDVFGAAEEQASPLEADVHKCCG